jgi:hypothetical protein
MREGPEGRRRLGWRGSGGEGSLDGYGSGSEGETEEDIIDQITE